MEKTKMNKAPFTCLYNTRLKTQYEKHLTLAVLYLASKAGDQR